MRIALPRRPGKTPGPDILPAARMKALYRDDMMTDARVIRRAQRAFVGV
jgi:hypothetical protein